MKSLLGDRGQMTVELCVVLPVALAIALIVVNAMTFFGFCAEFDRVARNAVRVIAASPAAGQEASYAANAIEREIVASIDAANTDCEVSVTKDSSGRETYRATLKYWPTLFGLGLRSSVFGVSMPPLTHSSSLTVDPYTPGELL